MSLERGFRRLVALASIAFGAVGLWQTAPALLEARSYQVIVGVMREVYLREQATEAACRKGDPKVPQLSEECARAILLGNVMLAQKAGIRDAEITSAKEGARVLGETRPLRTSVLSGIRQDLGIEWRDPGADEHAYATYILFARRTWPYPYSWRFEWSLGWPSSLLWWRSSLPMVALTGLVLSVGCAAVPWGLFFLVGWVVRGFRSEDRRPVDSTPTPEGSSPNQTGGS